MEKLKKKKVFSFFYWIIISILVLLLVCNLYNIIARVAFNETLPKIFGFTSAVVKTGSMSGAIEVGDMVIIHEKKDYEVGEIITYQNKNLITHRIVSVSNEGYITKGDNNNVRDREIVAYEQIEGKVVCIIPKIGYFVSFMKSPYGILIILAVGFIVIEFPNITDWITEKRKNKKGEKENEKSI